MLFYLNDVQEGGGTAFPVADNATFHEKVSNVMTPVIKLIFVDNQRQETQRHIFDAQLVESREESLKYC